jgi:hypothetical protein
MSKTEMRDLDEMELSRQLGTLGKITMSLIFMSESLSSRKMPEFPDLEFQVGCLFFSPEFPVVLNAPLCVFKVTFSEECNIFKG